ncbi:hypothetical protein BaRGS_00004572 [Batillaria attramentaria]|uniref:Uncharacterized protein n=1 Tax=Batillaria attramentaria TaxID=370345 RepID=A0ABD0LYS5_9CAEN
MSGYFRGFDTEFTLRSRLRTRPDNAQIKLFERTYCSVVHYRAQVHIDCWQYLQFLVPVCENKDSESKANSTRSKSLQLLGTDGQDGSFPNEQIRDKASLFRRPLPVVVLARFGSAD